MHYIIIISIIALIVVYQLYIYKDTLNKIKVYTSIFIAKSENYKLLSEVKVNEVDEADDEGLLKLLETAQFDVNKYQGYRYTEELGEVPFFRRKAAKDDLINYFKDQVIIYHSHFNPLFIEIIRSINNYLSVNKSGVSDFHLIKDIVDRNCDAQEEEINTQIPIPLYLGLVGTMAGIFVGIGFLWLSGGLNDLLNTGNGGNGADGVEALLGGVALAMFASITGILLTTFGSLKTKNAKAYLEKNKHIFLSWIQARLLPSLSNNTTQSLEKMSQNLVLFNDTFSNNTKKLNNALSQVNEAYRLQSQLFEAVKEIADKDVSVKNIQLYNALKNSTEEIETLGIYLNNTNDYLKNVKALNNKLDASESRTKAIEDMSTFFKAEIQQVEARKGAITKSIDIIDDVLQESLRKLKDHAVDQLDELKKTTVKQNDFLVQNSDRINVLVKELKQLGPLKEILIKQEQAARAQNNKLDMLVSAIQVLVQSNSKDESIKFDATVMPLKYRILKWSIISFGSLLLLLLFIGNWEHINSFLSIIINIFKF